MCCSRCGIFCAVDRFNATAESEVGHTRDPGLGAPASQQRIAIDALDQRGAVHDLYGVATEKVAGEASSAFSSAVTSGAAGWGDCNADNNRLNVSACGNNGPAKRVPSAPATSSVGKVSTSKSSAMSAWSSISTHANRKAGCARATCSNSGRYSRHAPHHSAHKQTTHGASTTDDARPSAAGVASAAAESDASGEAVTRWELGNLRVGRQCVRQNIPQAQRPQRPFLPQIF